MRAIFYVAVSALLSRQRQGADSLPPHTTQYTPYRDGIRLY